MHSDLDHWQEVSRSVVFERYGRSIECVVFALPTGERESYYIKAECPTTCVVALTPEHEVVLVRQFRPGPMRVLYELPGGFADPREDIQANMARELLEETGLAGQLQQVATCIDDAYSTVLRHCFVATECRSVRSPQHEGNEFIRVEYEDYSRFPPEVQANNS